MKSISLVVCAAAFAAGCTVNSATPMTAWGKKDVSMIDYRTDGGQCAVLAATHNGSSNGSNTAGGINGQNAGAPNSGAQGSATGGSSAGSGGSAGNNLPTMSGGTYRDSANPDFVNRAAMQQRSQEMADQRARNDALKSCLTSRGYTEFELTAEQRAALAKLPQGSDERREYLYKLGTDPEVLSKQSVAK
ncbi:MAG TPA: hypothetical protein VJP84_01300 [Steroidobacteraceae bacterium]|jgi:hypothetical protein|nr:hypothetical protein [Steroidobacteraceae bacterium]